MGLSNPTPPPTGKAEVEYPRAGEASEPGYFEGQHLMTSPSARPSGDLRRNPSSDSCHELRLLLPKAFLLHLNCGEVRGMEALKSPTTHPAR
jgi:hypothetical protein